MTALPSYSYNKYTVSQKKSTFGLLYESDICKRILIFFGRNITDKVSKQKTLYYATSNNLCFCTTWQNGKTRKLHFSLKCQNSTSHCLIYSIFLTCDSYSCCSLNLVIIAFSSRLLGGMVQEKGNREHSSSSTELHAQCTNALSSGFPLSQSNAEALER